MINQSTVLINYFPFSSSYRLYYINQLTNEDQMKVSFVGWPLLNDELKVRQASILCWFLYHAMLSFCQQSLIANEGHVWPLLSISIPKVSWLTVNICCAFTRTNPFNIYNVTGWAELIRVNRRVIYWWRKCCMSFPSSEGLMRLEACVALLWPQPADSRSCEVLKQQGQYWAPYVNAPALWRPSL